MCNYHLHFTNDETEDQRGYVCSRSDAGQWLSWEWEQGQSDSRPAVLHCLPFRSHCLKQSSISIHHRKGGNYAGPRASLTPPLSQLNGKTSQDWPRTPCPSHISTALCFLTSKLSWVRQDLLLYVLAAHTGSSFRGSSASENKGRIMGKRRSSLTDRRLWVPGAAKKKEGHSFRTLMNSEAKTVPLWKQYEGHLGEALGSPLLPGVRIHVQKDRIKIAAMPDTDMFAESLKIPITEPLEPKELWTSALAEPQLDSLITQNCMDFSIPGFSTDGLCAPPKNKSPVGYMGMLFPQMKVAFLN